MCSCILELLLRIVYHVNSQSVLEMTQASDKPPWKLCSRKAFLKCTLILLKHLSLSLAVHHIWWWLHILFVGSLRTVQWFLGGTGSSKVNFLLCLLAIYLYINIVQFYNFICSFHIFFVFPHCRITANSKKQVCVIFYSICSLMILTFWRHFARFAVIFLPFYKPVS